MVENSLFLRKKSCQVFFLFFKISLGVSSYEEAIIWIDPTNNYKKKLAAKERKKLTSIKLRIVKLVSPDGDKFKFEKTG